MSALHMNRPIWVWLYDYGPISHPDMWPKEPKPKGYPQAHTYAFESEEAAKAHPEKMGWGKDHQYVLQKVYLQ
jgi:hypothetical protein